VCHLRCPVLRFPVYAGEIHDKASANKKQGEVVIVLPPGLPVGTEVRIGLGLDTNEIFELKATLEDGRDLNPWIVKGDLDARVIELLTAVDGKLRELTDIVGPDDVKRFEGLRDEAFESMRRNDYDKAQDIITEMEKLIEELRP
jgi:hypothetical protein